MTYSVCYSLEDAIRRRQEALSRYGAGSHVIVRETLTTQIILE